MSKINYLLLAGVLLCTSVAQATIVQVKTNMGDFEINLFDKAAPVTVQNFLSYVNNGHYNSTVFHRSVPGFVIQGGGFAFDQALPLKAIASRPAITNEPKFSNVRGTVAMAKIPDNPNSATNQWFVNLADNSTNLDSQNGGFSVFGHIDAAGMEVIDAMAKLPRFCFESGCIGRTPELPLRNYTQNDRDDNVALAADNLVTIESITVVDNRPNTADGLNPQENSNRDSGGGSTGFGLLLTALVLAVWRRRQA